MVSYDLGGEGGSVAYHVCVPLHPSCLSPLSSLLSVSVILMNKLSLLPTTRGFPPDRRRIRVGLRVKIAPDLRGTPCRGSALKSRRIRAGFAPNLRRISAASVLPRIAPVPAAPAALSCLFL